MSRRPIIAAVAVLAVAGGAWWFLHSGGRTELPPPPLPPPVRAAAVVPGVWPARRPAEIMQGTPAGVLHFADELDAPNRTARDDVQLLVSLLELFRHLSHGGNPVGDNAEITAVLNGKNKLGYAFIRPDHPALNRQGELCDRWGTPFYFHQISGTVMEVRSAGPDRQHWTADDIAASP
jgi:hypothetical protein